MATRKDIEDRILQIISYIDQEKTTKPLTGYIQLLSLDELLQLLDFLENGNYKPIYLLLDKKIKEFLDIIEEIKQIKIGEKIKIVKQIEQKEKEQDKLILENILI